MAEADTENGTPPASRWSVLHAWPAWLALAAACYGLCSPDVPLALGWGRAVVEHGGLPATNVFSHMNPDRLVLLDKWLFQTVIYLIHDVAGPGALVLLRVALLALAVHALARASRIQWNWSPHAWLAVAATIALLNRCYVRAELVTWAAIPLTLCLLPRLARGSKGAWIGLLVLQAIWTNAHGYWVVGPMLCGAVAAAATLQPWFARWGFSRQCPLRPSDERRRLWIALPVSLAAACINPYGLRMLAHPVRLGLELQRTEIIRTIVDDFGSPLEAIQRGGTIPFAVCLALGLCGVIAALYLARRQRLASEALAVFGLGLVLGLPYYRNTTILALCATPLIADALRLAFDASRARSRRPVYALAGLPALLWLGAAFGGMPQATDYGARVPGFGWTTWRYPIPAANWIARNAPEAKLWNDIGVGGWLNWRLGEGATFIDGNTDGHPLDFLRDYRARYVPIETEPWLSAENGCTAALVEYGGNENDLGRFLCGVSWLESAAFGYADGAYVVVLATPDARGADARLTRSAWREIAQRASSGKAATRFSLQALCAVPRAAPNQWYARSGRLAIWLYPDAPAAQAHYARTRSARPGRLP